MAWSETISIGTLAGTRVQIALNVVFWTEENGGRQARPEEKTRPAVRSARGEEVSVAGARRSAP